MKQQQFTLILLLAIVSFSWPARAQRLAAEIYQSSAAGDRLRKIEARPGETQSIIKLHPEYHFQSITGFGGAFTEASASLLQQLSPARRQEVLTAYFSKEGANYSLTRTHMNSCDFSLSHYSYAPIPGDSLLKHFTVAEDTADLIPMIKAAQAISADGFKIIASPWTAPPWMKDNQHWHGGKLLPQYYHSWALFFAKYAEEYHNYGIDIWAFTVENEPLGNDANWESMHFSPVEMAAFVKEYLGPQLRETHPSINLLVYDQNRGDELMEWADLLLRDSALAPYLYGTAVHWYTGTRDWFPQSLQYTHQLAPDKHLLHTEGCIDAEVPRWQDDKWYWQKKATDWGYDWAPETDKYQHPPYVPVYRYARDIIGCLNNWVEGWVDWNMVLNRQGGPNHAKNWCIAPVIVDVEQDAVYYTPLYDVMLHFSKFIRPGARRIAFNSNAEDLMLTAVKNEDGSLVVVLLNESNMAKQFKLRLHGEELSLRIDAQAIQTIIL